MTIKYYHIFNLQNNNPELNQLVDDLEIKDIIPHEKEIIKWKIMQFMQSMRSDLHVIAENKYVDRVYRDSYYEYYATKKYQYSRHCIRLSFFENSFKPNINFNDVNNIKDNYLGFLVLRPLIACIGRNVINPKAKSGSERDCKICKVEVDTSCIGIKLKAVGFPHASQDSETMTCAQTVIWEILEYYGNKYNEYRLTSQTEIANIIKTTSYERLLPSEGLTCDQLSKTLRELGFGPKIYFRNNYKEAESYCEIIACYIESGIPLAFALTGGPGHAVVCIGHLPVDRSEVINYLFETQQNKKHLYNWNLAVANSTFIFNDDNYPCYQSSKLASPCAYYNDANWMKNGITHFIAPLYNKIYLEADYAIEASKTIVDRFIPKCEDNVIRTFLTSSRTFREHITQCSSFSDGQKLALLQIELPKFVWVTELSTLEEFKDKKANSLILLDATGSKVYYMLKNIIFLLSKRYIYKVMDNNNAKVILSSFPESFESFCGNLK